MRHSLRLVLLSWFVFGNSLLAMPVIESDMIVCPSTHNDPAVPDFTDAACTASSFYDSKPTGRQIWIKASLIIGKDILNDPRPLGIFISGKASSQVFLNGSMIGTNGVPAASKIDEVPGKMDYVAFVNPALLTPGENTLAIRLSSHHGFLNLASPMHSLAVNTYQNSTLRILDHYWPSLIPLGILLLGALFFGALAIRQTQPGSYLLVPSMALLAATQLSVEVARGLYAYDYPWHDIRLLLILGCSAGFGMCLLVYTVLRLRFKYWKTVLVTTVLITVVFIVATPGFDMKSAIALGMPGLISLVVGIQSMIRGQSGAPPLVLAISLFITSIVLTPGQFLDVYFFYFVAAFVLFLFVQQLTAIIQDRREKAAEKARADKLQLIIDQNRLATDSPTLTIRSGTKTDLVAIADIAYCKGAGDYVELVLRDGSRKLHSDSLTDLEQRLPSTFLRVHRSYIVNTSMIDSIERKKSGVGELYLIGVGSVPVSRRVMPSVREKLIAGAS